MVHERASPLLSASDPDVGHIYASSQGIWVAGNGHITSERNLTRSGTHVAPPTRCHSIGCSEMEGKNY